MKKNEELIEKISQKKDTGEFKPEILDLSLKEGEKRIQELLSGNEIKFAVDDYEEQLKELFAIHNPSLVFSPDFENKFQEY